MIIIIIIIIKYRSDYEKTLNPKLSITKKTNKQIRQRWTKKMEKFYNIDFDKISSLFGFIIFISNQSCVCHHTKGEKVANEKKTMAFFWQRNFL